jgi:hypothetical protein
MVDFFGFLLHTFALILSTLIVDPLKTISAFSATGALVISWKNLRKDATKVSVIAKRAYNGPLILQNPQKEYLLFEVYNQSISPIVINEVGIRMHENFWRKPKFINLIDLPYSYMDISNQDGAIGSLEYIGLPGTIPTKSVGILLFCYSSMREASINCQNRNISQNYPGFVGDQRLIRAFQEFSILENRQERTLRVTPYVLTGSRAYAVGKKAIIKLGNLGEALD